MTYNELAEQLADRLMGEFPTVEIYASQAVDPKDKADPAATITVLHEPPRFASFIILLGEVEGWGWVNPDVGMQLTNATKDPEKTARVAAALIRRFIARVDAQAKGDATGNH
ncbi:hypothetical protein [Lacticaseibacillus kribbianus]|uniref:hypothetical protein n=1 Tax=Lacticaseibacillus kribbianus TaxID=2926292 RepID=UPI001CD5432A|nr:hypothetical protein [Lacticaseibacillus kribbianus]